MGRKPDPNKRQHILHSARAVFAQKGYAGTRIIEVASAAGIGKGTVYEYFRSKEDLFFAVFENMIQETTSQLLVMASTMDGSASACFRAITDAVLQTWLPQLDLYSLVMEFWSAATALPSRERFKEAFKQAYADMRRVGTEIIKKGIASGEFDRHCDPEKISPAITGTWDFLLLQAWFDPEFDALGVSHAFLDVILRGLQCEPRKGSQ